MRALLCLLLAGCTTVPHVIQTPAVCPKPRTAPAMPDLSPTLPALPDASPDYAQDLLRNRIASEALYDQCLNSYASLRSWIND